MRIVDSMCSHVSKSRVSLNEPVLSIDRKNKTVTTPRRTITYDNLISTMPLPKLYDVCGMDYEKNIYSWNKVLVFNLGFDTKGPEAKNNWIYVPEDKYCFYRVGFYDNILGSDRSSLYVEIGFGKDDMVVPTQALLKQTLAELVSAGFITPEMKLVSHHSVVMDPAYVHITQKSEIDKKLKLDFLKENQIYSIGRYGAWKYCSLEDNIHDAFQLAASIR